MNGRRLLIILNLSSIILFPLIRTFLPYENVGHKTISKIPNIQCFKYKFAFIYGTQD